MLFNSLDFLIFFPCVILIYMVIPPKLRQIWLLLCSWFFYSCWNPKYFLLLLASTAITYVCALLMERWGEGGRKKLIFVIGMLSNLSLLFVFKYLNFSLRIAGDILHLDEARQVDILLPVGISFYTFQALGYAIDCYRGDVKAERSFIRYALFVSFFPQLVAGPIERSGNLLRQIKALPDMSRRQLWDYERIRDGLVLMAWGMFMKTVIADRIAILVDAVYAHYERYGTVGLLMGAFGFWIQIYCDFGSYSTIAVGAAKVMGLRLMENFRAPCFSTSVTDFWRRWHISMSSWFRDYLYIPLGGSRKGKVRKMINLLITFTVSGLWHGASWTYVFWGFLQGILLAVENILRPLVRRLHRAWAVRTDTFGFLVCRIGLVTIIMNFTLVFFRADTISDAFAFISRIFTRPDWWVLSDGTVYTWGLDATELWILAFAVLLLFFVDVIRVRKNMMLDVWLRRQFMGFRILFMLVIVMMTIVYGQYGPGFDSQQFIYFQF